MKKKMLFVIYFRAFLLCLNFHIVFSNFPNRHLLVQTGKLKHKNDMGNLKKKVDN